MKLLKKYNELFEGKLIIEDDSEFVQDIPEWQLSIDITEPWKKFENKELQLNEFNNQIINIFNENRDEINSLGAWNEIKEELEKLNTISDIEKANSIYNNIYDIADKHEIEVKC